MMRESSLNVGIEKINENKTNQGNDRRNLLIGLLCGFLVVIVGLVISIVAISLNKEDKIVEVGDDIAAISTNALTVNDNIVNKFINDDDYSYLDARRDFEERIDESDGDLKVYLTIYYAYFLKNNAMDLDYALSLLEDAKPLASNSESMINLYDALIDFYDSLGYDEKADVARNELKSIFPDEVIYMEGQ